MLTEDRYNNKMNFWIANLALSEPVQQLMKDDAMIFGITYAALQDQGGLLNFSIPMPTSDAEINKKETREEIDLLNKKLFESGIASDMTSSYMFTIIRGVRLHEQMMAAYHENMWNNWVNYLTEFREAYRLADGKQMDSATATAMDISKALNLNDTERDILVFQALRSMYTYGVVINHVFNRVQRPRQLSVLLKAIFQDEKTFDYLTNEKAPLVASGLVSLNTAQTAVVGMSRAMTNMLLGVDANQNYVSLAEFLLHDIKEKRTAASAFGTIPEADAQIVSNLIMDSIENEDEKGVNILVHGPRKIDKKMALLAAMAEHDITLYCLNTKDCYGSDAYSRAYIAQRVLAKQNTETFDVAALVVENASDVLGRRASAKMSWFMDKEEEDEEDNGDLILSDSPVPCIWLSDSPKNISEDNVARFIYHVEAKGASRDDRRKQIAKVMSELEPDLQHTLSKYTFLSHNQVKSAVRLVKITGMEPKNDVILQAIKRSQQALGRDEMEELRDSVTKYSLQYINLKNKITPDNIVNAFRKNPRGSMCLYGIPGSGKTQFAEYLAVQLDRPIIMKRASDLLSKWVGENEQNIRDMFAEARADNAILFLDEADSFLRDRAMAQAEWNVTKVNEILQQMERHDGIFICATNLFKDIDAAALRRFTFKLEFDALTPDQRWEMFQNEVEEMKNMGEEDASAIRKQINEIQYLTPGDFATVKRQALILGEQLPASSWIAQLKLEARDKLAGLSRNGMGFGARVD